MPTPKQIRDRLIQEQYQKFVVADIGNFPWCLNKSPEGIASGKRYKAYSENPLSRTPPFNQWGLLLMKTMKNCLCECLNVVILPIIQQASY
ncbi:hypothetical protein [Legionella longbeachae]|uniref:hypothetical protein n=1 Tax=Legionella longbeachae TaxID=450 RepID=UPI00399D0935